MLWERNRNLRGKMLYNNLMFIFLLVHCHILNLTPCPLGAATYYYSALNTDICYWLITTLQNVTESDKLCQGQGGYLAYVPDEQANGVIRDYKAAKGYEFAHDFYIGYKENSNKITVYGTNIIQTYNNWQPGQPDDVYDQCVVVYNTGAVWYDEDCTTQYKAVCSNYSPAAPPSSSTTSTTAAPTTTTAAPTTTTAAPTTTTAVPTTTTVTTTTTTTTAAPTTTTFTATTTTSAASTTTTSQPPSTIASQFDLNQVCPIRGQTTDCMALNMSCVCGCSQTFNMTPTEMQQYLNKFAEEIKKELILEKAALSSTIRKKKSAMDSRPSSTAMGSLGAIILVFIFGSIFVSDAPKFVNFSKKIYKKLKGKLQREKSSSRQTLKESSM